ncbi:MAG: GxxExxY protein [Flavobacterium sp.]|nr:GxxExxY protein [Flavobacterium sp.]
MTENDISYKIRDAIFKVYNELGPGLSESVYEAALNYQLKKDGFEVKTQVPVSVIYDNQDLNVGFRIDILVENKVIIEIKSVEELSKVHHKQILTYLKLTKLKLGILVNFNCNNILESIHRKVNEL